MSAWTAFGFGIFLGALAMDLAWQRLRKLEERLRERVAAYENEQAAALRARASIKGSSDATD